MISKAVKLAFVSGLGAAGIASLAQPTASPKPRIDKIVRMLEDIPTLDDFDMSRTAGRPSESELAARLEQAMRTLQSVPTSAIRDSIAYLVRFADDSTPEYREFRKQLAGKLLRIDPKADDYAIEGYVMKAALKRVKGVFWVDRFLFVLPKSAPSYNGMLDMLVQWPRPGGDNSVSRTYPVATVDGIPRLVPRWKTMPLDSPPIASDYLREFDYYASHYKRRSRWWK